MNCECFISNYSFSPPPCFKVHTAFFLQLASCLFDAKIDVVAVKLVFLACFTAKIGSANRFDGSHGRVISGRTVANGKRETFERIWSSGVLSNTRFKDGSRILMVWEIVVNERCIIVYWFIPLTGLDVYDETFGEKISINFLRVHFTLGKEGVR